MYWTGRREAGLAIHRDLVPILEDLLMANLLGLDRLFRHNWHPMLTKNHVRRPWNEGVNQLPDFDPIASVNNDVGLRREPFGNQ